MNQDLENVIEFSYFKDKQKVAYTTFKQYYV